MAGRKNDCSCQGSQFEYTWCVFVVKVPTVYYASSLTWKALSLAWTFKYVNLANLSDVREMTWRRELERWLCKVPKRWWCQLNWLDSPTNGHSSLSWLQNSIGMWATMYLQWVQTLVTVNKNQSTYLLISVFRSFRSNNYRVRHCFRYVSLSLFLYEPFEQPLKLSHSSL